MRRKFLLSWFLMLLLITGNSSILNAQVAKIGETSYDNFASALSAAGGMTGDVTVEILGQVEFVDGMELDGNYSSISFTKGSDDAKMTINQTAGGDYLGAHGKTVSFNGLTLAKANPARFGNSGHMGNYFSIQGGTVTYTNCIFPNGACTNTGTGIYNNCTFKNSSEYGLWVYDDAIVTVNGGTVDSKKGIKVYSEGEESVTSTLTVQNATFTANVTAKPAVAIAYAQSITLIGNTYNNTTSHVELDSGNDADCEGITFVAKDAEGKDISSEITAVDRSNSNASCGVLVDGKIYTTVTEAAKEVESGETITLLYNSTETVELPEGVLLDTNGYTAPNVTGGITPITDFASLKTALQQAGSYALMNNITVTEQINISQGTEVTLDLNGHKITASGKIYPINNDGILTINDNGEGGTIEGLGIRTGYTVNRSAFAELYINGGIFRNVYSEGAALYVHNGTVIINGGKFYGQNIAIANHGGNINAKDCYIDGYNYAIEAVSLTKINNATISGVCVINEYIAATNVTFYEARIGVADNYTSYRTLAEAVQASESGDVVQIIKEGSYDLPEFREKTLTFEGVTLDKTKTSIKDYVNKGSQGMTGSTVNFKNLTINGANGNYNGLFHTAGVTYNNCNINGLRFLYAPTTFTNCEFNANGVEHSFWTYGASNVTVTGCTFTYTDRAVNCYSENGANHELDITFSDCDFVYAGSSDEPAGAVEINSSSVKSMDVAFTNDCTAPEKGEMWYISSYDTDGGDNTIVKVNEETVFEVLPVAKIGDVEYKKLQKAIDAAQNDETITLLRDCGENVTITQKADVKFTIDGVQQTMTGAITVDGKSATIMSAGVTIKNVKFNANNITTDAAINLGVKGDNNTRYTCNVTVENCTFTDDDYAAVAIKSYTGGDMNLTVIECTATGMHSLAQLANVNGLKISDCNVNCARGIALGSSNDVTISGCKINASNDKYGVRADADVTINITIEDSEISAFIPVVVRDVKADASLTFNGTNTFTAANTDGLWCAIGYSEYETNGVMPEAPATGYVSVTLNDENLDVNGIYNAISGNGSENEPYYIKTVADLKFFRDQVNGGNNYAGKHVKLAADIDLNNENWTPIGNITYNSQYKPVDASKVFSGVFDGNGKVISNLKVASTVGGVDTQANVGLFGITGEGAAIKDLTLTNVNIETDGRNVGALAGFAYKATLGNITVNGNIQIKGGNNVAGVAGMTRYYDMSATNISVSGANSSAIVGNNIVGGIFAEIAPGDSEQTFKGLNVENVAITGVGGVGGIVGLLTTGTVENVSVKNVVLTGRTDYQGDAMGRIRLGSVAGLMGDKYATIANVTTENVTAKNLDGYAVVLPIIGANYSGEIGNATEAKIGDTYYATLQTAIDAAQDGTTTINILADITGDVAILQQEGKNIVIDGKKNDTEKYTFNGTINIYGDARHTGKETLTIQNVNFYTEDNARYFIHAYDDGQIPGTNNYKQYAHNVTVKNCNFATSAENTNNTVVGMRFRQAYNMSAVDCTSDGIFSIMWTTAVDGLTLNKVVAINCKEGITIGGASKKVNIIGGTTIKSETYAIRAEGAGSDFTIENSTLEAKVPVVVRKVNEDSKISFTFNGTNTITESNPTSYWFVAGVDEYSGENEQLPETAGQVSVTLNDTELRYEDVYGNYYELAGEGTAANPYTIANLYELKFFRDAVNAGNTYQGKYVKLTADIDLAEGQNRSTVSNWEPISTFNGVFDGNDKTIYNLVVNGEGNSNQGFFGQTNNGEIKNLTFNNAKVSGRLNVGVVAGTPYTSKYTNIKVTGHVEVNGMSYVGGVGGKNAYANWTAITVDVDGESYVKATSTENGTQYRTYVGGVIGFNGEGGHTFKNISSNINVIGDVCDIGGIFGIAHYGNKFENITHTGTVTNTNSNAEDVVETGLIAGVWHNQAGTSVTFTNTTSDGTISVPNVTGVTFPNDGLIGAAYTTSNETSSTSGSLTINGEQVYPYVAKIGEVGYNTLAKAITAAQNENVVTLLWVEGDAPIAMNASLYGKNVTITGTATVDWSKGWLYVAYQGADATLTFENAKLTSASNSSSYGINVSGAKNNGSTNNGTVILKDSEIELDYLMNRYQMTLDNSTLTVKNGFAITGRKASESATSEDATATMTLNNGSKVVVNNHNGMGIGHESYGIMNINSGSTFETTQSFLVTAKGTMNVNGGNVKTVGTLTNNGTINVTGESTLNIEKLEGSSVDLNEGAIVKNSTVGGNAYIAGNVTFRGNNTFAMISDYGDSYSQETPSMWTVEEGASLTLTNNDRYGLGYGDKVTVIGNIENALEARATLTDEDASVNMYGGLVGMTNSAAPNAENSFTATNAYLIFGVNGDKSFGNKSGNYYGNYTFTFNNSVVTANGFKFYEDNGTSKVKFSNSDLLVNGVLMTNDASSSFTFENSVVLSKAQHNGTDDKNQNAGVMTLTNTQFTYSAAFTNVGTLNLDLSSKLTAPSVTGNGTINIDATDFDGNEICVISANMASFEGVINVVGAHYMKKADGIYVTGAQGTLTKAYTSATGYWGECGGNANESFVLRFYNDDTYMGQTSLNDIDNIFDGDVYVTWSIDLNIDPNAEGYWAMSWDIRPTLAMQPNRVEQWIDGVKVAECAVEPNWADNIFPVVAAVTGENDVILSYVNNTTGATLKDAFAAGGNVTILRDFNLSETVTVPTDKTVVLDLNGKAIAMTNNIITTKYAINNLGTLTIEDSSTDKTGSVSARGIYNGYDADGNNVATAKITIEGGTFHARGENGSAAVYNYGIADIKGGKFTSVGSYSLNNQSGASMTIADGVEATGGIYNSGATLTVNGGKISNLRDGAHTIYSWDSNVTLKDGEIHNENSKNATIFADGTSEVNIVDGTFTIKVVDASSSYLIDTDSKLNISGGEFTGGIRVQANGYMSITEGTYHNNHGNYNVYDGGSLVISGGTFCENAKTFVEKYLAQGYALKELANGYYTVIQVAGTQTREFANPGWYWFSTYIQFENEEVALDQLQTALGGNASMIKGQHGFTNYSTYNGTGYWSSVASALTTLSTAEMYMIRTTAQSEVELTGSFVDYQNRDITLREGWNWIGYPVSQEMSLSDAIPAGALKDGDQIKSQFDGSATYYNRTLSNGTPLVGWSGQLTQLKPGYGYMFNSASERTFNYTTDGNGAKSTLNTIDYNGENHWFADATRYPNNMTVTAMLSIDGEIVKDNYEVAAFANGECRGSARPIYIEALDAYMLFMTIQGEDVENLTFKYYDVNYGTEYELNNTMVYSNDAILGTIEEPYMFNLGILNIDESSVENISIYPNPTTTGKEINLQAMCDKVEVFNALGVKVAEYTNVDSIDAIETAGIYVIRVTIDGNARNCRLIVR